MAHLIPMNNERIITLERLGGIVPITFLVIRYVYDRYHLTMIESNKYVDLKDHNFQTFKYLCYFYCYKIPVVFMSREAGTR